MDELEEKIEQITNDIDTIKSNMATSDEIYGINEKLVRLDRRITWLHDEIIGWLENNRP